VSSRPRILFVVGARPNFVKTAPVIAEVRRRGEWKDTLVHTGQHYDPMMSDVFARDLGLPEPDHALGVGSGSHAVQTARAMERLEPIVERERPDVVLVAGDVNSTLAGALVTAKLNVPLAHLESGLRSFDRTMPEELNRIVADQCADYLFAHSDEAVENLRAEGIPDRTIHLVGNTMIDTLVALEPMFRERGKARALGLPPGEFLLVTLHRPKVVDSPLLAEVVEMLGVLAGELPAVLPLHPRTRLNMSAKGIDPPPGVVLTEPLGYLDFLSLQCEARAVLTDSGGVQEETTYLGVPCFTFRDNTERPVTVRRGTNTILGTDPARLLELPRLLDATVPSRPPPLWDGHAASRVVDALRGP
jgi:UDP-N-acetylglucosamine 2-epimerase (non-hydrolysing)